MSNSGLYRDGPNQIKYEAQQVSLTYVKETPDTARISWNIPTPVFGCDENARAYNGIVITVSSTPVTQAQKPVNGISYTADATVSKQLHAGDTIGDAYVVGAFYDDEVTTSVLVADLEPLTPYYFSAYAVTAQLIYDQAGAHAYSLPIGRESEYQDFPAYQEVRVLGQANKRVNIRTYKKSPPGSMLGQASTNLDSATTYNVTVCSDILGDNVNIPLVGINAQTWDEMIVELNRQVALATNPVMSAQAPGTGSLFLDNLNKRLYKWSGQVYEEQDLIIAEEDPSMPATGSLWFDTTTSTLYTYDGSWNITPYIQFTKPYSHIIAGDFWANVSEGFAAKWEGATWCKRTLFTDSIDPSLTVTLPGGTFWYDEETGIVHEWDLVNGCWAQIQVMYADVDPSNLLPGQLWYNYDENTLYRLTDSYSWVEEPARVNEIAAKTPVDGAIWINPKTDEVKRYDFAAKEWNAVDAIHWGSDPLDRKSCDKWWNSTNDALYIWDFINESWVEVVSFIQSSVDPSLAPVLPKEAIWLSPEGGKMWDGMQWVNQPAVILDHDPRVPVTDDITMTETGFFGYNGTTWVALDVLATDSVPGVPNGVFWYKRSTMALNMRSASTWITSAYQTSPSVPEIGSQYFNTSTQTLLEWKNGEYVTAQLPVEFLINDFNNLMAVGKTLGSGSKVVLGFDSAFKAAIKPAFFGFEPVEGTDGKPVQPTYKTQGIGTDGSVDERREYANYVMSQMGYPKVQVELTKRQLDEAIDDALEVLRMRTSAVYTRSYVVLDLSPDQHVYDFTNRSKGLDHVTRVIKVLRMRNGRIGAYGYEDTFGSAMIQQLYYAGSFDLLSYHLLSQYNDMVNMMFANDIGFSWNEYNRTLTLRQRVRNKERVLVEVELERTEQELLVDRTLRSWIKKYVLGKCMIVLGRIRGKFGSLPGAGGGIALNGSDLSTEGQTMIEECLADIDNMVISGLDQYGSSAILMG